MGEAGVSAWVPVVIGAWCACSLFTYGLTFAYFQRKWPTLANEHYADDMMISLLMGAAGPIGLLVHFASGGGVNHGLKFR